MNQQPQLKATILTSLFQRNEVATLVSLKKLCFPRSSGAKNNFVYSSPLYTYYRVHVMSNN